MTYHTNHSWCNKSIWDDKSFSSEVMVYWGEHIATDSISEYTHKVPNPDFESLVIKSEFFDEESFQDRVDFFKERAEEKNEIFNEAEWRKAHERLAIKDTITLKPEVIEWLNENIPDQKHPVVAGESLADRKGWAIGNASYNSKDERNITVFFARQMDALKFIKRFSVFQKPTFYFDYFSDERREMSSDEILDIINSHTSLNLNKADYVFGSDRFKDTSTNLDYHTFRLLDWDKNYEDEDGYCDDIELTSEEKNEFIKQWESIKNIYEELV